MPATRTDKLRALQLAVGIASVAHISGAQRRSSQAAVPLRCTRWRLRPVQRRGLLPRGAA